METKLVVLLKYLPQLQAAGVSAFKIDGIEMALRMPQPEAPQPAQEPAVGRDPLTYGLPPGTKMPSLRDRRGG